MGRWNERVGSPPRGLHRHRHLQQVAGDAPVGQCGLATPSRGRGCEEGGSWTDEPVHCGQRPVRRPARRIQRVNVLERQKEDGGSTQPSPAATAAGGERRRQERAARDPRDGAGGRDQLRRARRWRVPASVRYGRHPLPAPTSGFVPAAGRAGRGPGWRCGDTPSPTRPQPSLPAPPAPSRLPPVMPR